MDLGRTGGTPRRGSGRGRGGHENGLLVKLTPVGLGGEEAAEAEHTQ